MSGWKSVYQSLEAKYEDVMQSVETCACRAELSDRSQFLTIDRPALTNKTKLFAHLQWKSLVHFLEIADAAEIRAFVYDPSMLPLSQLNWAALPVVLNTTLQLQIAYQKFQAELPRSLKNPKRYTNVEINERWHADLFGRPATNGVCCEGDDADCRAMRPCEYLVRGFGVCLAACRAVVV